MDDGYTGPDQRKGQHGYVISVEEFVQFSSDIKEVKGGMARVFTLLEKHDDVLYGKNREPGVVDTQREHEGRIGKIEKGQSSIKKWIGGVAAGIVVAVGSTLLIAHFM